MSENLKDIRLKPVKIELDKPRSLFYDFNAFAELEEQFGSLDNMFMRMNNPTLKDLRIFLWAGLLHELDVREDGTYVEDGEPFTPHKVGKILQGLKDLAKVSLKVFSAISDVMPKPGELKAATEAAKTND